MKRCSRIAIVWLLAVVGIAPAALGQGVSGEEGSGKSGNFLTDLGRDGLALPNWENAYWLLGGTGLTLGAYAIEDAAGARRALDRGFIDPLVDTGNIYGDQLVQVPLALTVTLPFCLPSVPCQALMVYLPGGTLSMVKLPSFPTIA